MSWALLVDLEDCAPPYTIAIGDKAFVSGAPGPVPAREAGSRGRVLAKSRRLI